MFLPQTVVLILFSFSIQNLNSFTKSRLLTNQWESQLIKKIELLSVKLLTTVYIRMECDELFCRFVSVAVY